MLVKFLADKGFCKSGETHDIPEETAKTLIEQKIAEATSVESASDKKPSRKFRSQEDE